MKEKSKRKKKGGAPRYEKTASYSGDTLTIDGTEFIFAGTNKGFNCTHYLFKSKRAGYLISFTDREMESLDWLQPAARRVTPWTPAQAAREEEAKAKGIPLSAVQTVRVRDYNLQSTPRARRQKKAESELFTN